VIVAGASPGETKMWAAVRENSSLTLTCQVLKKRSMLATDVVYKWRVEDNNVGGVFVYSEAIRSSCCRGCTWEAAGTHLGGPVSPSSASPPCST